MGVIVAIIIIIVVVAVGIAAYRMTTKRRIERERARRGAKAPTGRRQLSPPEDESRARFKIKAV